MDEVKTVARLAFSIENILGSSLQNSNISQDAIITKITDPLATNLPKIFCSLSDRSSFSYCDTQFEEPGKSFDNRRCVSPALPSKNNKGKKECYGVQFLT